VNLVKRTDGFFIETEDGRSDVQIINGEIRLINSAGIGKGYIITTTKPWSYSTPPSPPENLSIKY